MNRNKFVLLTAGIGVGAISLGYLVSPRTMLAFYGITLDSINEASFVRSAYGGLFLGFAALFLIGAFREAYTRPALLAVFVFMGGFALGRVVSLAFDGMPGLLVFGLLGFEIVYASLALFLLTRPADAPGNVLV